MPSQPTRLTKLEQDAIRVLDMLQKWDDRLRDHATQKRSSSRRPLKIKVTIVIPESRDEVGEVQDRSVTEVWTRNVSQSGLCFISCIPIKSKTNEVIVSLGQKFLLSRIVRSRQVHEGFWEYGLEYLHEAQM
jgi:hypothetical protein